MQIFQRDQSEPRGRSFRHCGWAKQNSATGLGDKQSFSLKDSRRNMSVKTDLTCSKFQANVFNKSRCQNCFKSRELHVMTSEEFDQAKPIYASWLCLAPEGTDFDNPVQRSRKWQRRFFILYEHGSLQFALDESPSTIPQGTADLNLCTEVIDAEARTGQKNALCIITPEQEFYIRGDSKEIINGWNEQLTVFLQTNRQNQRKKRTASSLQSQEQACETAVCSIGASETGAVEGSEPCCPEQDDGPSTKIWANGRDQDGTNALATEYLGPGNVGQLDVFHEICRVDTVESSRLPPRLRLSCPSPEPWATECDPFPLDCSLPPSNSTLSSSTSSVDWELDEDTDSSASSHDGSFLLRQATDRDETDQHHEECDREYSCLTDSRVQDDYSTDERKGKMCRRCRRRGRSRSQTHIIEKEKPEGFLEVPQSSLRPLRRARSLDGRASDSTMRPDLLNFKKGWLLSLNDHEQWRKYWFVLSAHSLRYYLDSGAEESSELVGEIDLTTCYQVTENQVQRSYGFQLHTHTHVHTLAAMTAGIRQNWIQAVMKNLQNHNAPDVASLAENHFHQVEALSGPDVTQDSRFTQRCPEQQSSHNRQHEHGAKTFGWDEVGHSCMMDPGSSREQKWVDLQTEKEQESRSRRRGREERRQRYAIVMGSSACPKDESSSLGSPEHQQQQQRRREIEERWLQVERTAIREGKKVLLYLNWESKSTVELEKLLEHYQRRVEQLTVQLTESADENQSLEQEHNAEWTCQEPTHDLGVQHKPQKMSSNKQDPVLTLTDKYQETKQLLQQENLRRQQISNRLGLCPSAHFIKEPEIKNECNVDCERTESSLASHAWCEASRDWEDEHSRAEVDGFSERAALVVKENTGSDPAVVNRFSQEAEGLARQNEALKQHNQELLNQLAEANREIDRLKAELRHQPNDCQPELESMVEPLEMELSRNREKLQEAQNKLAELEEHLKDTQREVQLREATLRGLGFLTKDREKISKISAQGETDRLCQSEIKLSEVESQLALSEQTCRERQTQNVLLRESELLNGHRIIEAEETIKMLKRELESDASSPWEGPVCLQQQQVHDGRRSREGIQRVVEESVRVRSIVLSKLLEVIKQIAGNEKQGSTSELENIQLNPTMVKTLQLEKNIWEGVVNALKDDPFQGVGTLLWYGNIKLEEIKMYLSALGVSTDSSTLLSLSRDSDPRISSNMSLSSPDIIGTHDGAMKDEKERTVLLDEQLDLIWTSLKQHVKNRLTLLNHVVSKLESPINEGQCDVCMQTDEFPLSVQDLVVSAGLDIFTACLVGTVEVQKERTLPIFEPFGSNVPYVEVQTENHERVLEQNNNREKTEANEETESPVSLKSRIKELEQLSSEGVKRLASLQQQHEEDKDRLKMDIVAAYERGFTLLKESHQKLTEDLLIKHQQEQELLQVEKERLLAEEAAATLTVIEAMKRAHCSELERVLQKAIQEKSSGDASIAEILKNHSVELASVERELDVLSELYSQKCLESVHLAQALEAERKALQHCQHQNLALHTRNQELNHHLAEEVIRLSTIAKEGSSQLVDDRQQYELEIMLRVKETEVIYLQQKISALKNELESAQTDQRLAIDRYQEIQMDHCMVKEKAEQQIEQLREHLRLAYEALAESVEKKTSATALNMAHYSLLKS
ncbi:myosin phosphatase Rho-interacting protein-like isoform X2 [Pygocentrus nattereri]|uniref:PH domain-containing protein n=1 Tax=Pygocentrus nattereri TaxID=42514 RepID=A0A3B4DXK7_PYGNA|nr:myosin phosphatase Rho-interacting protein-like isoform X2 [Pygocentrus nattereri]